MPFLLLLLVSISLHGQSILSVSPSGNGAGLEPLIRVQFSGPIDPNTLRDRISIEWGEPQQTAGFSTYPTGYRMPINQVAWDPATNTAYVKPDEALEHDRNYTVHISNFLTDHVTHFHTKNVTSTILARDLGPAGSLRPLSNGIIDLNEVQSISLLNQTSADEKATLSETAFPVPPAFLSTLGLRRMAFFRYESPRGDTVDVHAWIPNSPAPRGGYPVVLVGHGLTDHRFSGPTIIASSVIAKSVVLSINAVGHGYGPASKIRFDTKSGETILLPAAGRGIDLNHDQVIAPGEGCIVMTGELPDFIDRCLRETALDYRKLVREIQQGIDLDGDGTSDLDPNKIQYIGQSLGAMYGTILLAIEPGIEAGVLNVGGGSTIETARTSTVLRPLLQQYVAAVAPALADLPDPLTARYQPAQLLTDPRSGPYLELLDRLSTAGTEAAPASFAPFLKQATLYGNPIKRVLFQYALGDQYVANSANGQLIRAAFEYDLVSLYRHDLAKKAIPSLPGDPHIFLVGFADFSQPGSLLIALASLAQAGAFLDSGLREVPDVNAIVRGYFGTNLFEVPSFIP
ncbi:Ig-like domain-containing protein [Bryobacter aggregatus]|uniref:Ig-like domain-containing protein n=1 Tax=Bryobacter aggregatus TaxID=360054 RepID=UPI0004E1ABAB|nr:Ig-like domain-containing protein [Bryobacter aggregatus]